MKNRVIPLLLVPVFALVACTSEDRQTVAVPTVDEHVVQNADGSLSQHPLLESYKEAQAAGYTGTLDQFAELMQTYQTNPEQAQQMAADAGYSGGQMLLGALAGAAVGALAANAIASKTNMASNSYSAQRANTATNYAYSQPYNQERERRTVGYVPPANVGGSGTATQSATPKPAAAPARAAVTSSAVSRGGFGGAVSSGG